MLWCIDYRPNIAHLHNVMPSGEPIFALGMPQGYGGVQVDRWDVVDEPPAINKCPTCARWERRLEASFPVWPAVPSQPA